MLDNTAVSNGGGLNLLTSGTKLLSNSIIAGNATLGDGGGLFESTGNLLIIGTKISTNSAANGGDIVVDGDALSTIN